MTGFRRRILAVAAFATLTTAAGATVVVQKGDGGDMILTALASEPAGRPNVTLICNGKKGEWGMVLASGAGAPMPEGGADVTIKADGAELGRQHFDFFMKSLMLTINGAPGRAMFEKATTATAVEFDVGGTAYRFPLADGKDALASYRAACGL